VFYRVFIATLAAVVMFAAGCSDNKSPAPSTTSSASKTSASTSASTSGSPSASKPSGSTSSDTTSTSKAAGTLDDAACLKVEEANLELTTADKKDDARKAADVLEKYNPPANVKDAIEHLVEKAEASNDPDSDKNSNTVDDWIDQVCK
jgi:hypothetical protein